MQRMESVNWHADLLPVFDKRLGSGPGEIDLQIIFWCGDFDFQARGVYVGVLFRGKPAAGSLVEGFAGGDLDPMFSDHGAVAWFITGEREMPAGIDHAGGWPGIGMDEHD